MENQPVLRAQQEGSEGWARKEDEQAAVGLRESE